MARLKSHGITRDTPRNIMLGAGSFYKNLKFDPAVNNWTHDGVIGATAGGGTINIEPEYYRPDIDGATVAVKNLIFKISETATLEVTMTEIGQDMLKHALHLREELTTAAGYTKLVSTRQLTEDDYFDSIGFNGKLADGRQFIFILPNATCTGALEMNPQNEEAATYSVTFEATASLEDDSLNHLPYEIYYPNLPSI